MQLHALNIGITGDELFALAVLPKNSERFSLEAITLRQDEIAVEAVINAGAGLPRAQTESRWLPSADDGRLRLTLNHLDLKGGMAVSLMKKMLSKARVVSLIASAAGPDKGLSADGESLLLDAAPLLGRLGLIGKLTLQTISCTPRGLRFELAGTAKMQKSGK